jgi:endo-1,4-beta-xylanase
MRPKLFTLVCIALIFFIRAQEDTLGSLAAAREFYIGAAVAMKPFRDDDKYRSTLARHFNMIVAENCFKFDAIHPERDRYDFTDADALVEFAVANGMKVRGHTLIWHNQLPAWVKDGNFSRDDTNRSLKNHIETIVSRYHAGQGVGRGM